MRRALLVVAALALVAAGCSKSEPDVAVPTIPETTTTTEAPTTTSTVPPSTSSTVARTTTTTLVTLGPGDATIGGTVSGPAGPIDGATVRIERLVGKSVATADVTTSGGGVWQMGSILGGSYRVRAFKAPDYAQSQTESFFLAATDRKTIDFKLAAVGGDKILTAVNPSPPRIDQPAILSITVGVGRVDDQGRPALTPRPGVLLTMTPGPGIVLESSPQARTDANGTAAWQIRCGVEGADTIFLAGAAGASTQLKIPACAQPGATTTTR